MAAWIANFQAAAATAGTAVTCSPRPPHTTKPPYTATSDGPHLGCAEHLPDAPSLSQHSVLLSPLLLSGGTFGRLFFRCFGGLLRRRLLLLGADLMLLGAATILLLLLLLLL